MLFRSQSDAEARGKIEAVLQDVGLRPEETLGRYPHELSGGQRQRVMVARALLLNPRVIVADEPVSMIDASLRATVLQSLQRLNKQSGISIIYITHDLTTAYQIADSIVVMHRGSIVETGNVDLVVHRPAHPYTRLLLASIPFPNPDRQWPDVGPPALAVRDSGKTRCKFVERCSLALDICLRDVPPLYQVDDNRAAACFLHRNSPEVLGREVNSGVGIR